MYMPSSLTSCSYHLTPWCGYQLSIHSNITAVYSSVLYTSANFLHQTTKTNWHKCQGSEWPFWLIIPLFFNVHLTNLDNDNKFWTKTSQTNFGQAASMSFAVRVQKIKLQELNPLLYIQQLAKPPIFCSWTPPICNNLTPLQGPLFCWSMS